MATDSALNLTSVDLFAGCGGLSLGLEEAGFRHLGLVEWDPWACTTLRANAEILELEWPVFETDIQTFDLSQINQPIDLLAAGAPCQPFSMGGHHRADRDGRNMFPEVFRAIRFLQPRVVLLENVRGLKRPSFQPYLAYIRLQLKYPEIAPRLEEDWRDHERRIRQHSESSAHMDPAKTYTLTASKEVLHAADFGVPQSRHRLIMVAVRNDLGVSWSYPAATHSRDRLLWDQYVTGDYWGDHGLVARQVPSQVANQVSALRHEGQEPSKARWKTVRDELRDLDPPIIGQESKSHTFHVGIPEARIYKGHTGNDLDAPAKTIKAGSHGNPGGEHIIVKDDGSLRYLSVRECARMQSFPDCYYFSGKRSQAIRQIGNAVPPRLARILTERVRAMLAGSVHD